MLNKCVWSARFFGLITSNYKQWCLYLVASQKIESVKLQKMFSVSIDKKKSMHRPGIEPGPPAWQASILPLNHRCYTYKYLHPSRCGGVCCFKCKNIHHCKNYSKFDYYFRNRTVSFYQKLILTQTWGDFVTNNNLRDLFILYKWQHYCDAR
jgi:hypothetical protein